ncbi:uncharacterized protein LOC131859011 [Cryptomeria japonica]|uniref:uncharacterized protein LOC131859011 n=1 Tax=Cryptomeria japonica TaxID=3369 RepID=UPI0027D9F97F|nr:uncharacterized protein LOC131859011 [Cryptomeria japonica]
MELKDIKKILLGFNEKLEVIKRQEEINVQQEEISLHAHLHGQEVEAQLKQQDDKQGRDENEVSTIWFDGVPLFVEENEDDMAGITQDLGWMEEVQYCGQLMVCESRYEGESLAHEVASFCSNLVTEPTPCKQGYYEQDEEKITMVHVELATPVITKKIRKEVEEFSIAQGFTKELIDEAKTRFEARKAGTSSAPTSRKTRSENVKKEKPPPPPKIQIKRKEKQDEPQESKATGKKKEQAQRFFKAVAEEEVEETESEGEEPEMMDSFEEEQLSEAPIIEGELSDVFVIDQIEIESKDDTTSVPTVTVEEPVIPKVILTSKDEEKIETQENAQIDDVKNTKPSKKDEEMQKDT